jgi:acyl-homoserine lactone acylase PvdQ
VPPGQAERTYSPRSDVTIVRDKAFAVPHVYGKTRDGAMFGLGYAGAEDLIHWINRPTFQQANEIRSQVPR